MTTSGPTLEIREGHCIDELRKMRVESVHCVVTSPPYWGLRDYNTPAVRFEAVTFVPVAGLPCVTFPAWEGHLGMEPDPWMFVGHIVQVFREVKRVLRRDGTLWLNFGDCHAGSGTSGGYTGNGTLSHRGKTNGSRTANVALSIGGGLKPKDLCGIPWRVAFALQADGWWLRLENIWSKPNPMPESSTDRPTKSHEHIFLLSRSARYFYDAEAIKEPVTGGAHGRGDGVNPKAKWKTPDGWDTSSGDGAHGNFHKNGREKGKLPGKNSRVHVNRNLAKQGKVKNTRQNESFSAAVCCLVSSRNKRSVWTIATAPYPGAHFATFPAQIPRTCLLAGTSAHGACAQCGAPWKRVVEDGEPDLEHQRACGGDANGEYNGTATKDFLGAKAQDASATKARILKGMVGRNTVGWEPTCKCKCREVVPCIGLDPFGGSGTTAEAALNLGRSAVTIELAAHYIPLLRKRTGCSEEHLKLYTDH